VHAEMAAQNHAALEGQEKVLPAGLHALEPLPVDLFGNSQHRCSGVRRLSLDHLALE